MGWYKLFHDREAFHTRGGRPRHILWGKQREHKDVACLVPEITYYGA